MYYVGTIAVGPLDLRHYGVLGMKWGQHIFTDESKRAADSAKTAIDNAKQTANYLNNRKRPLSKAEQDAINKMSDEELRKKINRMHMESQYYQLSKSTQRRGAAKVEDILAITGSIVGIASGVIGTAVAIKQLKGKT